SPAILGIIQKPGVQRAVLTDVFVLSAFYLTTTFAHILSVPLYQLDPMKIIVLITVMYSNRGNALMIALSLPILSFMSTGHPVAPKFLLMAGELMIFATIMSTYKSGHWIVLFSAILVSKLGYYLLKAAVIWMGWLNQDLFATDFKSQALALIILSAVFYFLISMKNRDGKPNELKQ
ncbi:MAG: hypothetical protein HOL70_05060, partial [Candidatus Marinimicrobia bacterium]|nr:hypothetical protein [Candidatus Neomarinimicrobiota bacterium]